MRDGPSLRAALVSSSLLTVALLTNTPEDVFARSGRLPPAPDDSLKCNSLDCLQVSVPGVLKSAIDLHLRMKKPPPVETDFYKGFIAKLSLQDANFSLASLGSLKCELSSEERHLLVTALQTRLENDLEFNRKWLESGYGALSGLGLEEGVVRGIRATELIIQFLNNDGK